MSQRNQVTIADVDASMSVCASTMAMQGRLRNAVFGAISEADIAAIIQKQVQKAKDGDEASLQFIAKYVLGFGTPVNIKQTTTVVADVATAARIAKGSKNGQA